VFKDVDATWEISKTKHVKAAVSAQEHEVEITGVEGTVRFVQFVEKIKNLKTGEEKNKIVWIVTTAKHINLQTLWKIIHARWGIENNIFHQLKTEWHMKHCFIHDKVGLEAALMFMFIAFNLMQLYFYRRLTGFREKRLLQVEVIERIIKEMMTYDAKGIYILDTC